MSQHPDELIAEQIEYYRARADEYHRMLEREGRFDPEGLDPGSADPDTRELAQVERALAGFGVHGDVLEIACGPGWWTQRLAPRAASVTALDASPEMLALCREHCGAGVTTVQANIFDWTPPSRFDLVFFSFWLSHVPPDRFAEFWDRVDLALAPGGRVFFIDELVWDGVEGYERSLGDERGTAVRQLEDGRTFRLIKIYHTPGELEDRLAGLGWNARVTAHGKRIFHGEASRAG
ncbi:MAG: class I SAM-dependent methyltransferase [Candidatus Dormibacteria bacterium]